MSVVANMLQRMLDERGGRPYPPHLRCMLLGGGPAPQPLLEACVTRGVPVVQTYGLTETASQLTTLAPADALRKLGSAGKALSGSEVRIVDEAGLDCAPDVAGEIIARGPTVTPGYLNRPEATSEALRDGWLHTGDLGSIDEDGFVYIVGRKKDIIITAGGKNLTPANIENDMKQSRWISQAVMHGDRRPFPVMLITLDEEEIVPWARQNGVEDTSIAALAKEPKVHELVQAELDRANSHYAQVEQVKKFVILDHDLSQETGELTPTLKVKRNVVNEKYADRFEKLYSG